MTQTSLKSSLKYLLSVSALDATLIGLAWHGYFSRMLTGSIDPIKMTVLGLSIWLVYMSDRLFDVRHGLEIESPRHQFAKNYEKPLWLLWLIVLIFDIILSLNYLSSDKIFQGILLLGFLLAYTLLNQLIFKKAFPKELFVAGIFSYGVLFLIDAAIDQDTLISFGIICFLNCLVLSEKESAVDHKIGIKSLGSILGRKKVLILSLIATLGFLIARLDPGRSYLLVSLSLLLTYSFSKKLNNESFRALVEAQFCFFPLAFILF